MKKINRGGGGGYIFKFNLQRWGEGRVGKKKGLGRGPEGLGPPEGAKKKKKPPPFFKKKKRGGGGGGYILKSNSQGLLK